MRGPFSPYRGGMTEEPGEPQPDPHYLALLHGSKLPQAYLPAAMSGPQKPWVRVCATIVIACFVGATAYGTCLTYGLGHSF